jgi:hypothetical protein
MTKGSSSLFRLWTQDQIVCIFPKRKVSSTLLFLPWKHGAQANCDILRCPLFYFYCVEVKDS